MSNYYLTPAQLAELQALIDAQSGKPAAQQDWTAAYAFISSIIAGSDVSSGVQFFFQNADAVNGNSADAAANFFIRDYYSYAASLQGVNLTDGQIQAVSGNIGSNIFNSILNNGYVPESIKPIVDTDIAAAVTNIPGVSEPLSPATWGASLFADSKLGYDGFFDKYFTSPEDWEIFYSAASRACLDTGLNFPGQLLNAQDDLSCIGAFNMAGLYAQQQELAAEAQGTQLIWNAVTAGLDALWNLFVPGASGTELQNDLNTLDVFGSSSVVNGDVVVNLYGGDGSTGLLTFATDGVTSITFGPASIQFGANEAVNLSSTPGQGLTVGIAPESDGVSRDILLDQTTNSGELQQDGGNFVQIPVGSSVVLDNGDVAITTVLGNGVTVTTTWSQDGTLNQTFQSPDGGDPVQVSDQPDPATGTVGFQSGTINGQTTQVGTGDGTYTDSGLQALLGALDGNPPGNASQGGTDLTDPGDHAPDDPQAPFAMDHPSPPDPRDPLVLDLAGAGIELSSVTQSSAYFDFTGSGFATRTGWITPGEGLLVLDGNPNAPINVNELVGAQSGDGFADLSALDSDGDGVINASDPAFANLSVWVDANGNGQLDPGELVSLSSLGITSINLSTTPSGQTINGNTVVSTATFQINGTSGPVTNAIAEVDLATNPVESRYTPPAGFAYNSAVFSLPQLIGYGTVPDLWVAMSQDPQLLADVQNLVMNAGSMSAAQFNEAFQAVIWEWAGAANVNPDSRGSFIDARHLAVDYAFYGIDPTAQPAYQLNPNWHSGPMWETIYQSIIDELEVRFVGQIAAGQLLNGADPGSIASSWFMPFTTININLHNDTVSVNFNQLIEAIVSGVPSDPAAAATYYQQTMQIVQDLRVDLFGESSQPVTAACLAAAGALGYGLDVQTALLAGLGENLVNEGTNTGSLTAGVDNGAVLLGTGDKSITGGSNDVYVYTPAGGNDVISDGGTDAAIVLAGFNPGDVTVERSGPSVRNLPVETNVQNLVIINNATGETLTVENEFETGAVASIVFSDGTAYDLAQIGANAPILGIPGQTSGYDTSGNFLATYHLGAGNFGNVNAWHDQSVQVLWAAGDGNQAFTITGDNFQNSGSVELNNLHPSDVSFYRSGPNLTDLTIQNRTTGNTLTIYNEFVNPWQGAASVTFGDGTVWQGSAIADHTYITAASGSYGTSGLSGTIIYDLGTGTFGNVSAFEDQAVEVMWGAGDSSQAFTVTGNNFQNVGSLALNNLDPSSASFYRSGSNLTDLTIQNRTTGNTLTIYNEFVNPWQGAASVTFGDGTVWQGSAIAANAYITAASGSYGTSGLSGTIIYDLGTGTFGNVRAFEDQAVEVMWGAGDSSQAFTVTGNNFQNVGSVVLNNLDPSNVSFYRSGSNLTDLTIRNNGTGSTLTISNEFAASYEGVASITFGDGTVWQTSTIAANAYITAASGSYDTSGLSGTIIYDLGTGTFGNVSAFEDQAVEVMWGAGDSSQAFTITGNHFQNVGSLVLANLAPADVAFYRTGSSHTDLTIQNNATGNTLTFSNEFAASYAGIASVTFGDGTVWQASDIAANSVVAATPPTLSVTVSGMAQESQTLSATAVANESDAVVTYQWQSLTGSTWSNISGATSATYTAGETDEGHQFRVLATSSDSDGGTTATSAATAAVADIAPTLSATISGTAQEGQTLTASAVANDSDAVVTYQWQSLSGSTWSNISGATGSTYTAAEADEGHQLRVVATSTDGDGSGTTATSGATAAVVDITPTLSATISGTAQEGQTLTASAVANDSDAVVTYQWQSLSGSTWSNISGATGSTYTAAETDEGHQLRVVATSTDGDGSGTTATGAATAAVADIAPTLSTTISGTAQEGQTLTATAVANDSDAVVTYQWQSLTGSTWSNISGATGSTYTAAETDEGHQLRVVATSTDGDGGTTATSAATAAVADIAPTLSTTISGTAQEGQTLTASAVANDSDAVVAYQWQSLTGSMWSNISGATSATYTAGETDEGHQLRVVATSTDGDGSGTTATSAATAAVPDIAPMLSITVSGTAQEGQTLTATAVANDSDAVVTYQWQSLSGSTWSNISGATGATYTAAEADEGHQLRVVATSTDGDGSGTMATSAATAAVVDIAPTLSVTVTGIAQEGRTLTAAAVANDADAVVTYQWQSFNGTTWSNISGATNSTYTAAEADEAHQLRVVATSTDGDGSGTTATSAATAAVADITPTLSATISGTALEGQTLTASAVANDSDAVVTYQWQSLSGSTWSNISGATGSTYTAAETDEGHQLRVVAASTDGDGSGTTATSAATAAVADIAPALSVTVSGTAQEGQTLTASAVANDSDAVVTYQWQSLTGSTWSNISSATGSTYTAGEPDEGHQLRVVATSTDGDGSGTTATSAATAAVADIAPTLSVTVSGAAQEGQTLTASAVANDSDAVVTYQWQSLSGSTWSNISGATGSTYTAAETDEGHQLRVVATSTDGDGSGTTATSAASAAVADIAPTLSVTVSGTAQEGRTLTTTAVANDSDAVVTYQWQSLSGSTWSNISGATGSTYTAAETDEGHQLRVVATSTDGDGSGTTATSAATGAVADIAPTLSNVATTASYTEEGSAVRLSGGVSVTDPGDLVLASTTVSVTGGTFANDGDVLATSTSGTSITASYNSTAETLTLSGSDTLGHYQQVLAAVTFSAGENPTNFGSNPTRTVTWVLNDGTTTGAPATTTVTVTEVNDPPVLSSVTRAVTWRPGHAVAVSPSASGADPDSLTLAGATVAVTGGTFVGDGDVLAATTAGTSITASYNSSTETLTLSGSDTLAHYQSVLDSVTFNAGVNAANFGSNPTRTLSWVVNDGSSSNNLSVSATTTITIGRAVSNDFNDDGISDVLWRNASGEVDTWLMNNGQTTGGTVVSTLSSAWRFAGAGDLTGNGTSDVLWQNTSTGEVDSWLINNGNLSGGAAISHASSVWQPLGTGDFNGDRISDVLWRNTSTGEVDTWFMNNGQVSGGTVVGNVSSAWQFAGIGDFNGDGTSDVLWHNAATGEVDTWLINNGYLSGGAAIGHASSVWQSLGTGDFNGDGTSDILWRNTTTGEVDTWIMNNGQVTGGAALGNVSSAWQFAGIGDFTGSGTSDILWRNANTGEVDTWLITNDQMTGGASIGTASTAWQPQAIHTG